MAEMKRDAELGNRQAIKDQVNKIGRDVDKGFEKQQERSENNNDYWDAYNCVLSDRQFYNGTSQLFLPFIHDAIEARKTRYVNQLFPSNQRYVEVITENGDHPHAQMSLLEHYVRREGLRSRVVRPLLINGDLEGQYSVYVSWRERKRNVTSKALMPVEVEGLPSPSEFQDPVEEMHDEEILESGPTVEVIADNDLLVLPATADTIDDALDKGGSVTVVRRWSKGMIKAKKAAGEITNEMAESLEKEMGSKEREERNNTSKQLASAAGIKIDGGNSTATIYEIWAKLKVNGERRLCRIYWAGEGRVLSVKLCPYWCDKVPVISAAVEKVAGVFKGRPPVSDVLDLQILANDTINEGADTAHFSAMPIIMTDPARNPRVESMVLGPAAIWKTSPQDTSFAQFPELWRSAFERASELRQQIFQTLSVNPSMIPGSVGGKQKRNQAEIANEQQVDILQTADAVLIIEEDILSPMLQRFAEYDHQFRDDKMIVRSFGEIGRQVVMEEIEPQQMNRRYEYRWFGVEASRNAAQNQQQIAAMNVLRGIPPQFYQGYRLDLAPAIVPMVENVFGPRVGPLVFKEIAEISVDPMTENSMLEHGFEVQTHPGDDDMQHMQAHMMLVQQGDPHGTARKHLMLHQQQAQAKAQAQQAQMQGPPQGAPGAPGMQGTAPGAVPQGPQHQGPPGMIAPDQMARAGGIVMPRKM
jgi:hypothetical protein